MKTSSKRLIALLFLLFPLFIHDGVAPRYTPELPSLSGGRESTADNTAERPSFISMQREAFEASKDLYIDMGIIPEHKDALIFNPAYQDKLLALPEQHIPTLAAAANSALASYAYDFPPLLFEKMRASRKSASPVPLLVSVNNAPQSALSSGQNFRPSINKQSSQGAAGSQALSTSSAGSASSASSDVPGDREQDNETEANAGSENASASSEEYAPSPKPGSLNVTDAASNEGNESPNNTQADVVEPNPAESHEQAVLQQNNAHDIEPSGDAANPSKGDPAESTPPNSLKDINTDDIYQVMTAQDPPSVILVNSPITPDTPSADKVMQTLIHEPSSLWFFLLLPLGYWVTRNKTQSPFA